MKSTATQTGQAQPAAQHTPENWLVSKCATPDYAPQFAIYGDDCERIAIVFGDISRADVIASAPTLLACTPVQLGLFDAVAMNPPFHMRADIRHILHALTFLKPGGKCAALCFDTASRERALRHLSSSWEPLPAGLFGKEGTGVATVLATFTN